MEKPGGWYLLEKCVKNTSGKVTFEVKMQVINLNLNLKRYSSTGVFHLFC